jgi:glycosyltransferase involved in cell wall biosynthesis
MRIILTVDPEIPVPPVLYGGIERIVDGLAKGYSEEGHEVFLIAHPDSTCAYTKKNYAWPALKSRGFGNTLTNMLYLRKLARTIKPDIIHSFSRLLYGYPIFIAGKIPFVQSYQRKISPRTTGIAYKLAENKLRITACAAHMLKDLPNRHIFKAIFNFTDTDYFNIDENAIRECLVFLGRIEDIKGTKEAIEAAIQTNNKIIIAGNIQPGHDVYFETAIKPFLSNPLVRYIGPVNDEEKRKLLQQAKAMLFPIKWEEPFGIVLAESLACGAPVIGFNRGSVPEVIQNGRNGFITENVEEMKLRIAEIDSLNNKTIRIDAVERFSLKKIACQYLELFNSLVKKNN